MKKLFSGFVLCMSLALFSGCGDGEVYDGHASDKTPGGEANTMDDMSPEGLQKVDQVGKPATDGGSGPIKP